MKIYSVLTGDIVKSSLVAEKAQLVKTLTETLETVQQRHQCEYDIYRGDSFQVVVPSAPTAALIAIIIRAKLIASSPQKNERWDARISIGIGGISYRGNKITDSDGTAFQLSGKGMDTLNKKNRRLGIKSPWEITDNTVALSTRFADDTISHWSRYSAETAYYSLVYNESQSRLADRLGKSQPTINIRIATAKLELIREYIQQVSEHITRQSDNDAS